MAGVRLEGEVRATTYEPPERIEFAMEGDLEGRIWWTFEAEDGGTRVTYGTEYEIPVPVLKQVAEAFARRYNEREVETLLYVLAVVFGVVEVPSTTVYGVWRGKDELDWQHERLKLDARSPKLDDALERFARRAGWRFAVHRTLAASDGYKPPPVVARRAEAPAHRRKAQRPRPEQESTTEQRRREAMQRMREAREAAERLLEE